MVKRDANSVLLLPKSRLAIVGGRVIFRQHMVPSTTKRGHFLVLKSGHTSNNNLISYSDLFFLPSEKVCAIKRYGVSYVTCMSAVPWITLELSSHANDYEGSIQRRLSPQPTPYRPWLHSCTNMEGNPGKDHDHKVRSKAKGPSKNIDEQNAENIEDQNLSWCRREQLSRYLPVRGDRFEQNL